MKTFCLFLFLTGMVAKTIAQVTVDNGYTILSKDSLQKMDITQFLLADPYNMVIKENASGKTCSPTSIECSFIMKNEVYKTRHLGEIQQYLKRLQPKDKVIIEKILLPSGCFAPPRKITIEVH